VTSKQGGAAMKTQSRSIELMVNEQLQKWQIQTRERKTEKTKTGPVITISREPGSGGSEIARKLAKELNLDLAGQQIIQKVAESSEMSAKVIASLDEKEVLMRDSWLESLFKTRHLWPEEYLFHLTKVIGTMGRQGSFILVGRGAQYILPPEDTFRLRFIAPMEFRIANVMKHAESSRGEAEQYIVKTDSDRRAFIRKYFNADVTEPSQYDMIINTGKLGIDGSVETIKAAITVWMRSEE
jgi:cytidylate kinase